MAYTILVTAPRLNAAGVRKMEEAGCRILYLTRSKDAAEVASLLATHPIDAVISRTLDLTEAAMRGCPTLKVVLDDLMLDRLAQNSGRRESPQEQIQLASFRRSQNTRLKSAAPREDCAR